MLTRVTASEYVRPASVGRTKPVILVCADSFGVDVELYAKLSARCEAGATHLAREAIAACLAGDLGLPVPQPFLVDLPAPWIGSVADDAIRAAMAASVSVAFGSRIAGAQFAAWHAGNHIRPAMVQTALGIFTFDALIQNADRRDENPNCLVRGDHLRIIDHELTFMHKAMLAWQPPWVSGALQNLAPPGRHIFRHALCKQSLDFASIRAAWSALSDERLEGYAAALPPQWASAAEDAAQAISLVKDVRDHIDACLTEVQRVLT